jgi:hypothetical protein
MNADGLCGTKTFSKSAWSRKLIKHAGCIVVDETGAAVPSEVIYRGEAPRDLPLLGLQAVATRRPFRSCVLLK